MDRIMKDFCNKYQINPKSFNRRLNCFGFAFNIYDWLYIRIDGIDPYLLYTESELYNSGDKMVDNIIEQTGARIINNIHDLQENEYAVAFRFGKQDFHFIRRGTDGKWYEKCGSCDIHFVSKDYVFGNVWDSCVIYDSELYLFAVKY